METTPNETPKPTSEELKMKELQDKFNQISHQRGVLEFQHEDIEMKIDKLIDEQYNTNVEYQKLFDKWQAAKKTESAQ